MGAQNDREILTVAGREVAISNPGKVLFPQAGHTKLDLARYYFSVAEGALRAAGGRPNVLVRYPNGIEGEFFYQKRAPTSRPDWIEVVTLRFPSGRSAEEVVPRDAAALLWMANLACLELHPHPVRDDDLDRPDELRVDLDPVPGIEWSQVREVARVVQAALTDLGLVGWPKTSGSRGMHIYVRIAQRWTFDQVRRAALALARDVERRAPALATSKWWKEERHGVFLDYNQNAKDRTIAAAYSVRPRPDARVSAPLEWDEIAACDPADFTLATMPARFARVAIHMPRWIGTSVRSTRSSSSRHGTSATVLAMRRGRRTTESRRESRRACSRHAAARRRGRSSRSRARSGRKMRSRGSTVGRSGIRKRRSTSRRLTCSSMRCEDASGHGRGFASISSTSPTSSGLLRKRWIRTKTCTKHLLELVGGRDLELIVAAVARFLVRPPAYEDRAMTEARPLHVVVLDLADALDPNRFPRQILAGAPPALTARHPRAVAVGHRRPLAPRMSVERVRPKRFQFGGELATASHRERRRDAHVMQCAAIVVQSEQQRAHERVLARSCAIESRPRRNRPCARASP